MGTMKLEYAAPALVDEIVKTTGQRANLIAICCHQILSGLPSNQKIIEAGDVRALHSEKTFNHLRGWEQMTQEEATNRLDRIVVYATIGMENFSFDELIRLLQERGVKVETQPLDRSLKRLELGFVLGSGKEPLSLPRAVVQGDDLEGRPSDSTGNGAGEF